MNGPTHRIRAIEASLRCFALGVIAQVPWVGLPAAILAMSEYSRLRREIGDGWNPAHIYLVLGHLLAWLGIVLTLVCSAAGAAFVLRNRDKFGL